MPRCNCNSKRSLIIYEYGEEFTSITGGWDPRYGAIKEIDYIDLPTGTARTNNVNRAIADYGFKNAKITFDVYNTSTSFTVVLLDRNSQNIGTVLSPTYTAGVGYTFKAPASDDIGLVEVLKSGSGGIKIRKIELV